MADQSIIKSAVLPASPMPLFTLSEGDQSFCKKDDDDDFAQEARGRVTKVSQGRSNGADSGRSKGGPKSDVAREDQI